MSQIDLKHRVKVHSILSQYHNFSYIINFKLTVTAKLSLSQKLCLSKKFPHQEIKWNYGIFRSDINMICDSTITKITDDMSEFHLNLFCCISTSSWLGPDYQ